MTPTTAKGRPAATERPFTPTSRGNGSTSKVPAPTNQMEQNTAMIAPAPVTCRRLAAEIRTAAVAHVALAAGVDPVKLTDPDADLMTRELIRVSLALEVRMSELARRAVRLAAGDGAAEVADTLVRALREAAVERILKAADVDVHALDDDARHLTAGELDAIAGVLGVRGSDLMRAAQLAPAGGVR